MSPESARRPLGPPMESREPHSIRYTPTEWERIVARARECWLEPSVLVRKLTLYALDIEAALEGGEASPRVPLGALGIRRF